MFWFETMTSSKFLTKRPREPARRIFSTSWCLSGWFVTIPISSFTSENFLRLSCKNSSTSPTNSSLSTELFLSFSKCSTKCSSLASSPWCSTCFSYISAWEVGASKGLTAPPALWRGSGLSMPSTTKPANPRSSCFRPEREAWASISLQRIP